MRRLALASLLSVAFVCTLATGMTAAAKSIKLTVNPVAIEAAAHPLVGDWQLTTTAGTVPAVFGADGTVVLEFPPTAFGTDGFAFVDAATGTWEPVGAHGANFTAVQTISHANGVFLGTSTIVGYLTVSDDGMSLIDGQSWATTTVRDANNAIVSMVGTPHILPAVFGARFVPEIEAATVAGAGGGAIDPGTILGNGGRDCAGCIVVYAPDNVTPMTIAYPAATTVDQGAILGNGGRDCISCGALYAPVETAATGQFEAHGANLSEPAAAPSRGGGCNTCR
ncbi:MAG: hypothetical protein M3464_15005 [Chloroflexota bacterium]|nr:hypothetical protein [Chloroflexota bacterium]